MDKKNGGGGEGGYIWQIHAPTLNQSHPTVNGHKTSQGEVWQGKCLTGLPQRSPLGRADRSSAALKENLIESAAPPLEIRVELLAIAKGNKGNKFLPPILSQSPKHSRFSLTTTTKMIYL